MPKTSETDALWDLYVSSPELTLGNLREALKQARDLEDRTTSYEKASLLPAVLNMALQLMPKSLLDILMMGPRSLSVHPTHENALAVELPYHGGEKHILLGTKDYRCCPLLSLALFLETRVEPPRGCQGLLFAVQDLKNVENLRSFVIGHLDNAFGASFLWFKSFDRYLTMVAKRKGVDKKKLNARRSWKSKSAETFDMKQDVEVAVALAVHGPIEYVIDKGEAARFTNEWICDNIVPNMVAAGIDRGVAAILGRTIVYASLEPGPLQLLHDELREDIISACSKQRISALNPVERLLFEVGSSLTKPAPSVQPDENKAKTTKVTEAMVNARPSTLADSEHGVVSTTKTAVEGAKVLAMTARKTSMKIRSTQDDGLAKNPEEATATTLIAPTMHPDKQKAKTTNVTNGIVEPDASIAADSEKYISHGFGSTTAMAVKVAKVLVVTDKKTSMKKRSAEHDIAEKKPKKSSSTTRTPTMQSAKKKAKTTNVTDGNSEAAESTVEDLGRNKSYGAGSTTRKAVDATKVLAVTKRKTSMKKRSAEDEIATKKPKKSSSTTRTPTMQPAKKKVKTTTVTDEKLEAVASTIVDSEENKSLSFGATTTKAVKVPKALPTTEGKTGMNKGSADDHVVAKKPKRTSLRRTSVEDDAAVKKTQRIRSKIISAEVDGVGKQPKRTSSKDLFAGDHVAATKPKKPKNNQNGPVAAADMDKVILVRDELLKNLDQVVNVFVSLKTLVASLGSTGSIEGTANVPRRAVDLSSEAGDSDDDEVIGRQDILNATAYRRKKAPVDIESEPKDSGDGKKAPSLARKLPAKLSTRPGSLERLWDEYSKGLGGNKPAERFTEEEKRAPGVHAAYSQRSGYWQAMEKLLEVKRKGMTPQVALAEIERCYFPLHAKMPLGKKLDFIYVDQRKGFEKLNKVVQALESVGRKEG